ncbi:hypothetical protein QFC21_006872 [Naganishia friedmannii]|uniref:Uncharacterized protein n=1 Tax=Naganishia friedmannii TaxID=89922 RepID=A0ACC2V0B4_9TREE|nr:hypothetical protein QFC21_006872 [Naganishia friedmannii]
MLIPPRSAPSWDDFLFDSDSTTITATNHALGPTLYPLEMKWHLPLVFTSYFISALGGYTSTQLMAQVRASKGVKSRIAWIGLASVVFGGCGIWSMHFVSMLALDLNIPVSYNIPVTILSAIVAILATFTTFGYELVVHYIRKLRRTAELKKMMQPSHPSESERLFPPPPQLDSAAGLDNTESYDSVSPMSEVPPELPGSIQPLGGIGPSRRRWTGPNHSDDNFVKYHMSADNESEYPADNIHVTATTTFRPTFASAQNLSALGWSAEQARSGSVVHFEDSPRVEESSPVMGYPSFTSYPPGVVENSRSTPSTSLSSHPDPFAFERSSNGSFSSETMATLYGPGIGKSWAGEDELSPLGSRRASIVQLAKIVATRFTYKVVVKGVLMGLAVVSMHYTGMGAMRMEGTIIWNWWLVALSILDACIVCMIAIIFMPLSQSSFTSQIMFALVSGFGVSSMHYCGMFAANFHTTIAPEDRHGGYQQTHSLPWSIAVIAFASCLISYVLLAHTVTSSRDELVEAIRTKRALWRTMAEKEAAVRSDKMKMDFISVASHEIRTPLHVIAGYVDLLAQTELTGEQQEYIAALRSGCASIRLITSDVLDFAKLQNPNAESRARSAEIDIRQIAYDVVQGCCSSTYVASVRSIPSKSGSSSAPADRPDIILEIDREVPTTVFLDEVYVTRILMNLLNNALKFCTDGFILVRISMSDITDEGVQSLCISVYDTGIGIAKDFQSNIFAPFRQADTSLTRKHTGTGLGLAICYQLATSMHGNMAIWSQQGEHAGTELSVYLPLDLSTRSPIENQSSKQRQPLHLDHPLSTIRPIRDPPTRLSVGLLTRSWKKQAMLTDAFAAYGFQVEDLLAYPVSRAKPLDRAWIDIEAFSMHPDKVAQLLAIPSLQVFVLCENASTLARDHHIFGPTSPRATVTLMPRPINIIEASEWLRDLGLAVSFGGRRLQSGHGGSAGSQNTLLSIPVIPQSTSSTPPDERIVSGMLEGEAPLRVLLVDDNLINQRLGVRLLSKMKYDVDTAENGQVALDKVTGSRERYSLVLMDCQMPVLDGFAATRKIRQAEFEGIIKGHLPIIALTANVSTDSRERCIEAGADHFLAKPLNLSELHECIKRFV